MVYALFMILVLLTFGAMWRGHALQIPLFFLTIAVVLLLISFALLIAINLLSSRSRLTGGTA